MVSTVPGLFRISSKTALNWMVWPADRLPSSCSSASWPIWNAPLPVTVVVTSSVPAAIISVSPACGRFVTLPVPKINVQTVPL